MAKLVRIRYNGYNLGLPEGEARKVELDVPEAFKELRALRGFREYRGGAEHYSAFQLIQVLAKYPIFKGVSRHTVDRTLKSLDVLPYRVVHGNAVGGVESGHYSPKGKRGFQSYQMRDLIQVAHFILWRKS